MSFLDSDLLARIHERAVDANAANTYPKKDLEELRKAGYLSASVPTEFGGADLGLTEIAVRRTTLAKAAPGMALGINMYQIIIGFGRYLVANDNARGEQILRDAIANEVFGFGISEPGNDLVLFGSTVRAIATADGGCSFENTKTPTSLSPVWARLLIFGRAETEEGPKSVFDTVHRDDEGYSIKGDWSTLGMHVVQSMTTLPGGVTAPEECILMITDPGSSADSVIFGIFSHSEILLVVAYQGVGKRVVEVAAKHVATRRLVKSQTIYPNDPDIRWHIAEAVLTMDAVGPQIRELVHDIDEGVDRGRSWTSQLSAVKNAAAEATLRAVEQAMRIYGGSAYYNTYELSRLYRDALAGLFQPSDQESLHAVWAGLILGPIERAQ